MKKISIFNRHRFTANSFYVFCIFLIFLLSGCGGESDDSFSSDLSETASASFTIAWHSTPVIQAAGPGPEPVDCTVVENIICKVYDGSDNTHLTSEVFDCYGGEGTIEDIPVGDNREFVILGEDADQNILYHGVTSGITLEKGQTADVGTIDTFPFVPEGLSATADSSSQITLTWDGTDNVGVSGYNIYRDGSFLKSVTSTSTSDTGLSPSTTYCYTVSAYDAWDNESGQSSPPVCAITHPPDDIEPPTMLTAVVARAVSASQINLFWNESTDNVDVTGYNIYRDGSFLKSVTSTSTSDTGLSPSTQYCYTVSAFDAAGNKSGQSSPPVCATTHTPPDTTAPTVRITSPTSGSTWSTFSGWLNIAGTASVGVTLVTWANNRGEGESGTCSGTTSWSASGEGGIYLYPGSNVITVTARDEAGNTGTDILTVTYTEPV